MFPARTIPLGLTAKFMLPLGAIISIAVLPARMTQTEFHGNEAAVCQKIECGNFVNGFGTEEIGVTPAIMTLLRFRAFLGNNTLALMARNQLCILEQKSFG